MKPGRFLGHLQWRGKVSASDTKNLALGILISLSNILLLLGPAYTSRMMIIVAITLPLIKVILLRFLRDSLSQPAGRRRMT